MRSKEFQISNCFKRNCLRQDKCQISNNNGQTLLELVVVIAVIIIVVGALTFATIASLRNASFSQNQVQATKLAQEAIERVRIGRDRNKNIVGLVVDGKNVFSWDGNNAPCRDNTGSIWCNQININCGNTNLNPPIYCFFNINSEGELLHLTAYGKNPDNPNQSILPPGAESIPPFTRAVIISDHPSTKDIQKTVTAVVTWTDISGFHESRLTTILSKL